MRNVEIKVRLRDGADIEDRLVRLPAEFVDTLHQHDVFFAVPTGRLKLRTVNGAAELIQYVRSDDARLRTSDYARLPVADGAGLRQLLQRCLPITAEVRKVRRLYRWDNVRIHLDAVEGLGDFLELEAVVDAQHDEPACHRAAQRLLDLLQISREAFESRAYADLLADLSRQAEKSP